MGRFTGGWIRIDRRMVHEDIGAEVELIGFWVVLLSWANVFESKIKRSGKQVVVERGQVVTSISELSARFCVDRKKARRWLAYLESTGRITSKRDNRGTIITICNFDEYQTAGKDSGTATGTATGQPRDSHGTATGTRIKQLNKQTRKQEDNYEETPYGVSCRPEVDTPPVADPTPPKKEAQVIEPKKPTPKRLRWEPEDMELAKEWHRYAQENWPYLKGTVESYANAIRLTRQGTDMSHEQMAAFFRFVRDDDFWRDNCQSPVGLLKRSRNGNRKVDNILASIRRETYKVSAPLQWAAKYRRENGLDEGESQPDLGRYAF